MKLADVQKAVVAYYNKLTPSQKGQVKAVVALLVLIVFGAVMHVLGVGGK